MLHSSLAFLHIPLSPSLSRDAGRALPCLPPANHRLPSLFASRLRPCSRYSPLLSLYRTFLRASPLRTRLLICAVLSTCATTTQRARLLRRAEFLFEAKEDEDALLRSRLLRLPRGGALSASRGSGGGGDGSSRLKESTLLSFVLPIVIVAAIVSNSSTNELKSMVGGPKLTVRTALTELKAVMKENKAELKAELKEP